MLRVQKVMRAVDACNKSKDSENIGMAFDFYHLKAGMHKNKKIFNILTFHFLVDVLAESFYHQVFRYVFYCSYSFLIWVQSVITARRAGVQEINQFPFMSGWRCCS